MIWLKGKMLGGLMQIKAPARRDVDDVHLDYALAKSLPMPWDGRRAPGTAGP
jgi:hypothetical protein